MNRYETIVNNEKTILSLICKNIVPVHILDWKVYYEAYLQDLNNQKKNCSKVKVMEAMKTVAANYDVSNRHMQRIVAYMEAS